ncbi:MAG: hypothetical protein F4231_00780 [Acidimicrobiaceae bacterium]|nr:hypothetical protein [Acidimicrobiaceae bacterium]
MLTGAMGRRAGLALAAAAVAVGVWTVGPAQPKEASAEPYFGLMCSDVTDAHYAQLGDTITCIENLGGHSPRRHVNSWRLCVAGPGGISSCRTGSSGCAWINGHTPPSSSGNCGHSCHTVWRGYTGIPGASCSFVSHYDTPHVHVGFRLGTRTRPSCSTGQHRDGGSGSCHSHPRPACTTDGTYTAISGNGHTTSTTAICGRTPDPDPDPACSTGLSLTEQERVAFLADLSWETLVDINPQGPPGERWPPHPDVPGGSEYLVVADSPVWTVIDSAALWSVPSPDGCVWEATDVEVLVMQLLPWRSGDRLDIESAAEARPDAGFDTYLERWDRLSAIQRSQAQRHHPDGGVSHTCGFADAKDPARAESQCSWELPWAGVWNWSISACFEGVTTERTYEECAVLDQGVEWFLNILDYTRQITLLADETARE